MKLFKISESEIQEELNEIGYPTWLSQEILRLTNNYKTKLQLNLTENNFKDIAYWAAETHPKLEEKKLEDVAKEAIPWAKRNKELELAEKYSNANPVYKFKDGWVIVPVPKADLEIERKFMTKEDDKGIFEGTYGGNISDSYFRGDYDAESQKDTHTVVIYSLRNKFNFPEATIEISYKNIEPKNLYLKEVFSKDKLEEYDDGSLPLHKYRSYIKEFINDLKSKGYTFKPSPITDEEGNVELNNLDSAELEDQFGMSYYFNNIGGDADGYRDNIEEAERIGWGGANYFNLKRATDIIDSLIDYATRHNDLDALEKGFKMYEQGYAETINGERVISQGVMDKFHEYLMEYLNGMQIRTPEDEPPSEEDFMLEPDKNQLSIPNVPPPVPTLDKEAYEEALEEYNDLKKQYDDAVEELEKDYEPFKFSQYIYEQINYAKNRKKIIDNTNTQNKKGSYEMTIIKKIAKDLSISDRLPNGEELSLQVNVLKMHLKDNPDMDKKLANLIHKLPSPRQVRQDFSKKECEILYETVEYVWKNIAGEKLVPEKQLYKAPETLKGNYWLLPRGILLKGLNHYSIAKQNENLICTILDIGGWTFQEYLCSKPNELVWLLIKHGAVRLFINSKKELFSQMSSEGYAKIGRSKIRKYDFQKKVVKLIDLRVPYKGWSSGITIKL